MLVVDNTCRQACPTAYQQGESGSVRGLSFCQLIPKKKRSGFYLFVIRNSSVAMLMLVNLIRLQRAPGGDVFRKERNFLADVPMASTGCGKSVVIFSFCNPPILTGERLSTSRQIYWYSTASTAAGNITRSPAECSWIKQEFLPPSFLDFYSTLNNCHFHKTVMSESDSILSSSSW